MCKVVGKCVYFCGNFLQKIYLARFRTLLEIYEIYFGHLIIQPDHWERTYMRMSITSLNMKITVVFVRIALYNMYFILSNVTNCFFFSFVIMGLT